MKKFLGEIYYNIYAKWNTPLRLIIFLVVVSIPIEFLGKISNVGNLLSAAWFIFIITIPYIAEQPNRED